MEPWTSGRHKMFIGGTKYTSGEYEIVPAHSSPGGRWNLKHNGEILGSFKHLSNAQNYAEMRQLGMESRQAAKVAEKKAAGKKKGS